MKHLRSILIDLHDLDLVKKCGQYCHGILDVDISQRKGLPLIIHIIYIHKGMIY
jgi:hypothetical protein